MEKQFMRKVLLMLAAMSILLISSTAFATTHVVPGKFSSIQEAIDAAVDGDVISVRPGIYYENLTIGAKSITVKSMNGPGQTILDGSKKDPVVSFVALDTSSSTWTPTLDGFTIQNGVPSTTDNNKNHGGGIAFYNGIASSQLTVTINNCNITNNSGNIGSAIGGWGPPGTGNRVHMYINNSSISNNTGGYGAIYSLCTTYIINNTNFVGNTGTSGAIHANYLGVMSIYNSYFSGNTATDRGGAIGTYSIWSYVNAYNTVFDLNTAANEGGAVSLGTSPPYNHFNMNGCTVTRNSAPVGAGISQSTGSRLIGYNNIIYGNSTLPSFADYSYIDLQFSDVEGGLVGTGNINADPMFVNPMARDYQLAAGSPAIDSGSNGLGTDIFGVVRPSGGAYDMGAYEVVALDTAAPVSTATVTGTVAANGYYSSDVTFAISAQDNIAVKEVHYNINGIETVIAGNSASFTLSADGTYAVSYFVIDTSGNAEAAHVTTVLIDKTPPVSNVTINGLPDNNTYFTQDLAFRVAADDNVAVKEVHYIINGVETISYPNTAFFSITTNGTYTVSYFAVDSSGNVEAAHTFTLTLNKPLDTQAPVSIIALTGVSGSNGYFTSEVTVAITAQDNVGVREIQCSIPGFGTYGVQGASGSFVLSADGTYAVSCYAVDTNGNSEVAHTTTVKIDKTAPTVSSTYPSSNATGVSTSASVTVTFKENILQGSAYSNITLKRGTSTVSSTKSISGNKLTIKPSNSMSESSNYTVTIPASAVKDSAGNNGAQYSFTFKTR